MKNKIIAIDLDGTSILNDGLPSKYTTKVINQLSNEGYTFVIITGRSWYGASKIYNQLKLKTPIVLLNGVYVMNPQQNKKVLFDKRIYTTELKISDECENYSLSYKMDLLEKQYFISNYDLELLNCDKYSKGYTKADGAKYILEFYNKKPEDLIFIGDGDNDIDIIEFANFSIAMSNASDLIKQKASRISDYDYEHDGCVKAILRLILESKTCRVIKKNIKGRKFKKLLNFLLERTTRFSWKYQICDVISEDEKDEIIRKQISMINQGKEAIDKLDKNDPKRKTLEKAFAGPINIPMISNIVTQRINQFNQNIRFIKKEFPQDFLNRCSETRVHPTFLKEFFFESNVENINDLLCISQLLSGLNITDKIAVHSLSFYFEEQLVFEVISDINMARIFLDREEYELFKELKIKTYNLNEVI